MHIGVWVSNFRSLSFLVWSGDLPETDTALTDGQIYEQLQESLHPAARASHGFDSQFN